MGKDKSRGSSPVEAAIAAFAVLVMVLILDGKASSFNTFTGNVLKSQPVYQVISKNIVDGSIKLGIGSYKDFQFTVPRYVTANVSGFFKVSGVARNNVRVYVLDQANYAKWRNGRPVSAYYDSEKMNTNKVYATLPSGTYHFIVSHSGVFPLQSAIKTTVYYSYKLCIKNCV